MAITLVQYHHLTSYQRYKLKEHYLDWENQPTVYKFYPGVEPIPLPTNIQLPEKKLSSLFKIKAQKSHKCLSLDIKDLSRIFLLTYRLTAEANYTGGKFYFRNVASAGALYPAEIYVATHGVNGLNDGLYHFSIAHQGLYSLRRGNFPQITKKTITKNNVPFLTFFISAIFFRSAWKYRERSYRYHLLDTGHLVENLSLSLKYLDLPFVTSYDFDDGWVNRFLGLDIGKECTLAVSHVLGPNFFQNDDLPEIEDLPKSFKDASRVAEKEISYSLVKEIHQAGTEAILPSKSRPDMVNNLGVIPDNWTKIDRLESWPEATNYVESVFSRRSRRNFVKETIPSDFLTAILNSLSILDPESVPGPLDYYYSISTGLLVGRAEKFKPGFYLVDIFSAKMGMVKSGFFMDRMSHICLDQAWLANAALHFLFMTNLETLEHQWGARGYRYAMMTAGRMGERLYLVATALGLGCCGIGALYDEEARKLLGLNHNSRLLYLVAVGPVKTFRTLLTANPTTTRTPKSKA